MRLQKTEQVQPQLIPVDHCQFLHVRTVNTPTGSKAILFNQKFNIKYFLLHPVHAI
jgi:hypothetical protein